MFEEILGLFPESRERRLRRIERFAMFDVFFYRSNLWHHGMRVALIIQELTPLLHDHLPACDTTKARILALVHDDAEMITGDVQLGHKMHMSAEELQKVHDAEAAAIEVLSKEYPQSIAGYPYRALLVHALERDCLEAELLTYADKLDAYCESLHEVLAGNISALRAVFTYVRILGTFEQDHPNLAPLFSNKTALTDIGLRRHPLRVDRDLYAHLNTPHTEESITQETDFMAYNAWRALVLKYMGHEGLVILTKQKEFLRSPV